MLAESFVRGMEIRAWHAKWITPEEKTEPKTRKGAGYLLGNFIMSEELLLQAANHGAFLYATAHGLYDLKLNGQRITEARFTPGCDEYTKRLQYQCYQVTPYLRAGENTFSVTLGDGWYRGCVGIDGTRNLFGEDLSFLAELQVEGQPVFCTDEAFKGSQNGPVLLTDLELGETYDARKEEITDWHPVRVLSFGFENLVPTETVPVKEKECFAGKRFTAPNGDLLYDFSQNLAGYTRISVKDAKPGEALVLVHGETLDEKGNFTIENFQPGARNRSGGIRQELRYICKGGEETYSPLFSVFGFRYAKLMTDIPADRIRVESAAVYSDMKEVSAFLSGHEGLNQLYRNAKWSMKSNFLDIPTDCPTRERAGWIGDAAVFVHDGLRLMDCAPVYRKWLKNLKLKQYPNGKMAYICPSNGKPGMIAKLFSASVGWGDACVIVPWELYLYTGDRTVLTENYEMMRRWVRFLQKRARRCRLKDRLKYDPYEKYRIDTGMDYGEWNEPGANVMETMKKAMKYGQPEVGTAYLAYSSGLLSKIAALLGKTKDAEAFGTLSENAKKAYRMAFLPDGRIHSERQCEYVRPIAFGLLTEAEERKAAEDLDQLIRKNGFRLNTGFLSTGKLLPVLLDHGYTETAYRLLLQEENPSWLYAVKRGATTIWENWDAVREDGSVYSSLNHYSYGTVAGTLVSEFLGIRYDHTGLTIRPHPDRSVGFMKGSLTVPEGTIRAAWAFSRESEEVSYEIEIPEGISGVLKLPSGKKQDLRPGRYCFSE